MDTHKTVKNLGWPWSLHWCPACPCELTHILYSMCTCTIRLGSFHRLWQLMCLTFRAHLYIYIMLTIINHQACNILAQDAYIMPVPRYRGVWMFKWFFVPEVRKWKEFEVCITGADEAWLSNEHLHFISWLVDVAHFKQMIDDILIGDIFIGECLHYLGPYVISGCWTFQTKSKVRSLIGWILNWLDKDSHGTARIRFYDTDRHVRSWCDVHYGFQQDPLVPYTYTAILAGVGSIWYELKTAFGIPSFLKTWPVSNLPCNGKRKRFDEIIIDEWLCHCWMTASEGDKIKLGSPEYLVLNLWHMA